MSAYPLVFGKFAAVVRCYGQQFFSFIWQKQPPHGFGQRYGFFPCLSFDMSRKLVLLSIMVKMAWLSLSTMRSISQSPKRLPSASAGLSWMLTRLRMAVGFVVLLTLCFLAYFILWRQFCASSPVSSSRMNL